MRAWGPPGVPPPRPTPTPTRHVRQHGAERADQDDFDNGQEALRGRRAAGGGVARCSWFRRSHCPRPRPSRPRPPLAPEAGWSRTTHCACLPAGLPWRRSAARVAEQRVAGGGRECLAVQWRASAHRGAACLAAPAAGSAGVCSRPAHRCRHPFWGPTAGGAWGVLHCRAALPSWRGHSLSRPALVPDRSPLR